MEEFVFSPPISLPPTPLFGLTEITRVEVQPGVPNSNANNLGCNENTYQIDRSSNIPSKQFKIEKNWKCNAVKRARDNGLVGVSKKGQPLMERTMKKPCDNSCRFKCTEKITEQERQEVHEEFWAIANHTLQWEYISQYMTCSDPKERKKTTTDFSRKRRSHTFRLHIGEENIKVCQTMFVNTLGISRSWIKTIDAKMDKSQGLGPLEPDQRGRYPKKSFIVRRPETITLQSEHYAHTNNATNLKDFSAKLNSEAATIDLENYGNNHTSYSLGGNTINEDFQLDNGIIQNGQYVNSNRQDNNIYCMQPNFTGEIAQSFETVYIAKEEFDFSHQSGNCNNRKRQYEGKPFISQNCDNEKNDSSVAEIQSTSSKKTVDSKDKKLSKTEKNTNTSKEKVFAKKKMRPSCGVCRFNCKNKITEEQRQKIHDEFWGLNDHSLQWAYIARRVLCAIPKQRKNKSEQKDSRRRRTRTYLLIFDGQKAKVCQRMFLNTLGVTCRVIATVDKKKERSKSGFIEKDQRGMHRKKIKNQSFVSYAPNVCTEEKNNLHEVFDENTDSNSSWQNNFDADYKTDNRTLKIKRNKKKIKPKETKKNALIMRPMRNPCGVCCRFACQTKIGSQEREKIHQEFWSMIRPAQRWEYIARHVISMNPRQRRNVPLSEYRRKTRSHRFYLSVNEKKIKVCLTMFVNTLGISSSSIRTVDRKKDKYKATGRFEPDQRGKRGIHKFDASKVNLTPEIIIRGGIGFNFDEDLEAELNQETKKITVKKKPQKKQIEKKKLCVKEMRETCGDSCRFNCEKKISEEQRRRIHKRFWSIGDRARQWEFVAKHVKAFTPKQSRSDSEYKRKKRTHKYILPVDLRGVKVCMTMFFNTLGISNTWIKTINAKREKCNNDGSLEGDMRGKHSNRRNKLSELYAQSVHEHFHMFPYVYTNRFANKPSKEYFLKHRLSSKKLHELYSEWMQDNNNDKKASASTYRKFFSKLLNNNRTV